MNSMTGYAAATGEFSGMSVSLELRAVNSRYLEINFRIADELRSLEPLLRERLQQSMQRGKVECRIAVSDCEASAAGSELNPDILQRLARWTEQIRADIPDAAPLAVADILRWPGVMIQQQTERDMTAPCLALLDQALPAFVASRQREGAKLAQYIVERLDAMQSKITELEPMLPELIAAYRQKLKLRFDELTADADNDRIMQEIALFAQKIDVGEEMSRLQVHIQAVRRILQQRGAIGKELDFLMQELNREANTLGSKSVSVETTRIAMALKVLIEQMREQVQNLE
ncbi:MAG TPA: YicC/YloC family endoribonuclease [Burkholderiales bacterium]|nr:YicC/YloC family endoribonuclease [Burkholderiales bacterium]